MNRIAYFLTGISFFSTLTACIDNTQVTTPTPTQQFEVGGQVSGISDSFVTIGVTTGSGEMVSVSEEGAYRLMVDDGSQFDLQLVDVPAEYNCQFANENNSGTVSAADITDIDVSCRLRTQVSLGFSHTCALLDDRRVRCWGDNLSGQLGNGTTTSSLSPVLVSNLTAVQQIAMSGTNFGCALIDGGNVRCWGGNNSGQLGNATATNSNVPVDVVGINNAVQIDTGNFTACAVLETGAISCWGSNANGVLGNGSTVASAVPVSVQGITNAVSVSVGNSFTCALLADATAKCWGTNAQGRLGNGMTTNSSVPVDVTVVTDIKTIEAGGIGACALLNNGRVKCWGGNTLGNLGNGNIGTSSLTAVDVVGLENVQRLDGYVNSFCALLADQSVRCWGTNTFGALGNGNTDNTGTPTMVNTSSNAFQVRGGGFTGCAVVDDANIECWGRNASGQLGNGMTVDSSNPVGVVGL